MQIKKFEAPTIKEALKQIKQEFGPDAVILSINHIDSPKGFLGLNREQGVEVSAAIDPRSGLQSNQTLRDVPYGSSSYAGNRAGVFPRSRINNLFGSFINGSKKIERGHDVLKVKGGKHGNRNTRQLYSYYQRMLEEDVNQATATDLIREVSRYASSNRSLFNKGFKSCLVQILDELGIRASRVKLAKESTKIVAFVGPAGVGKTTTIAKLAAAASTRERAKRVALITLDDNRIGAIEQLKIIANILGMPLKAATNKYDLKTTIDQLCHYNLIFIDTPGISHSSKDQIDELMNMFSKTQDVEFHLLVSAATNDKSLSDISDKFGVFDPKRIIFTKLDECVTYGPILNQLFRSKLPVSYFTNGPNIPEDIEAASIEKLIGLVIPDKEPSRYLNGPPEIVAQKLDDFEQLLGFTAAEAEVYPKRNTFRNLDYFEGSFAVNGNKQFSSYHR